MKAFMLSVLTTVLLAVCMGTAAGSHWDVAVTKTSGDTVWVRVEVDHEGWTPCAGDWVCISDAWVHLMVDPCPVFVPSPGCFYEQGFHTLWPSPVTLQLRAGVAYTFSGDAVAFVGDWDPATGGCHFSCWESSSFQLVDFGAPVATKSETWGGIKALFR